MFVSEALPQHCDLAEASQKTGLENCRRCSVLRTSTDRRESQAQKIKVEPLFFIFHFSKSYFRLNQYFFTGHCSLKSLLDDKEKHLSHAAGATELKAFTEFR